MAEVTARHLILHRGTTAQLDEYIGYEDEITLDTEKRQLRCHDGLTPGGEVLTAGGGSGTIPGPINLISILASTDDLPAIADTTQGDAYLIEGHYWVAVGTEFKDVGNIQGPNGLSAYEIAVSQGYTGSVAKWLESLRGADGIGLKVRGTRVDTNSLPTVDNINGDAYIVNAKMFVWVNDKWVEVGQVGPRGYSAYQLAIDAGTIPPDTTLVDWLNSLNGMNAYELALDAGTIPEDWTLEDYLLDLRGKDAYEIAVALGRTTGTRAEFLDSLRGERGPQGERGAKGDKGQPANAIKVLGRADTAASLPTEGSPGDGYYVDRDLYVYNGDTYINVGPVVGERGEMGPQGLQGDVGPEGPQGLSAFEIAIAENVFSGDRSDWVKSLAGKSAYELAVQAYGSSAVGTTQQWLASLKGKNAYETALELGLVSNEAEWVTLQKGPAGPEGPQGPQGDGITIKGYVDQTSDLPTEQVFNGDIWSVVDNLFLYLNGEWKHIGTLGGIRILGTRENPEALPLEGEVGDSYLIGETLYTFTAEGIWENAGLVRGPKGDKGDIGKQGLQGIEGPIGPKGDQGPEGARGLTGPQGPKGDTGAKGDEGEKGASIYVRDRLDNTSELPANPEPDDGYLIDQHLWVNPTGGEWVDTGLIEGPRGLPGEKGDKGDKGDAGADGARGPTGYGARILGSVNSTTDLPRTNMSNGDAYIIGVNLHVYNNGQWSNMGPFRGPSGAQGLKGDTGERGPEGYGIQVVARYQSVDELPETAELRAGHLVGQEMYIYNGTDWINLGVLAGVKGEQGPQGPQGQAGPQGIAGPQGPQGRQGERGLQGFKGDKGDKGDQGEQGEPGRGLAVAGVYNDPTELPDTWNADNSGFLIGDNIYVFNEVSQTWVDAGRFVGPQGIQGPKGEKGDQGTQGLEGVRGPRGTIWIHEARAPDPLDGETGDYYINTDTKEYFNKINSLEWTLLGTIDGSDFAEAPSNGQQYARMNGYWAPVKVGEAPEDGYYYLRRNASWVRQKVDVTEVPEAGKPFARVQGGWEEITLTDAPKDDQLYVRRNGNWYVQDVYTLKASTSTGVLDLSTSQVYTLDGNTDLNIVLDHAPTEGRSMTVVLTIEGNAGSVTWPSVIQWNQSLPPVMGEQLTVVVLFWTGSLWVGSVGVTI